MVLSRSSRKILLILLALLALGMSLRLNRYAGPNLYGLQAQAWLEGRLDVPGPAEDLSLYGGRYYVAFPPFPSLVLLPVVALTGHEHAPYRTVALVLAGLAAWLAWRVLRRLELPEADRPWLVAALLAGTAFWYCVVQSEAVWFLAHVVAVTCSLLALEEALGPARGARAGLWAGLAFLSRQLCVYLIPFIVLVVWWRHTEAGRRRQVREGLLALTLAGVCGGVYLLLNALRFGSPFNTGYAGMPLSDFLAERVARYGLFHPTCSWKGRTSNSVGPGTWRSREWMAWARRSPWPVPSSSWPWRRGRSGPCGGRPGAWWASRSSTCCTTTTTVGCN
jgi:4-amino-4-deoxy-L-arabinose transferase-like glycosyltransferase